MEVPRLGVQSELQLPAYTTATATPDTSRVCDLHHSSRQHQILNLLIKARDRTCILMDPIWVHYLRATMETPLLPVLTFCLPLFFFFFFFFLAEILLHGSCVIRVHLAPYMVGNSIFSDTMRVNHSSCPSSLTHCLLLPTTIGARILFFLGPVL